MRGHFGLISLLLLLLLLLRQELLAMKRQMEEMRKLKVRFVLCLVG